MPNKEKISVDVFLTEINSLTCILSITCYITMSNAMIENKKKYSIHKLILKFLRRICYLYIDTELNTNFVSHDFDTIKHIDI